MSDDLLDRLMLFHAGALFYVGLLGVVWWALQWRAERRARRLPPPAPSLLFVVRRAEPRAERRYDPKELN